MWTEFKIAKKHCTHGKRLRFRELVLVISTFESKEYGRDNEAGGRRNGWS